MTKVSDGGKGSAPRPFSVSNQEYAERWDAIFARKRTPPPGCELACETYSQCPRRIPCDRLDEYQSEMDAVDHDDQTSDD